MISVRHFYVMVAVSLSLSFFFGWSALPVQAEMTEPQIRLVYATSPQLHGKEMNPAFQEEILQEIRLYRILDTLINQLTLEIEVDGNESVQGGVIFEIPIEVTTPPEPEQPQLQLDFEIHPDNSQ